MKTDKQLLQLSKNDLLKEYRNLEHELGLLMNVEPQLELNVTETIAELRKQGYIVTEPVSYKF